MYWALWAGFCIGKCIAGWLAAGCWLLAAFAFFFLFLLIEIIKIIQLLEKKLIKIWGFKRDKNIVKKLAPQKVGPLYLLYPLLITSGSELTLFTFPLLIACPHDSPPSLGMITKSNGRLAFFTTDFGNEVSELFDNSTKHALRKCDPIDPRPT